MNDHLKGLMGSMMAAIGLMVCLGIGLIGVMVLGRGEEAIEEANSESEQDTDCQFTAAGAQLIVYQAPIKAQSQQKAAVIGGETYPIIKQNNGYYLLQLADDDSGWANGQDGTTDGDCEDVPIDETLLSEFPTVCVFNNPQEVNLYSEADLVNAIATVPPGMYLIESTTGNQYYIILDGNISGWVGAVGGQITGACEMLPVAPG
jgi:hypothetical protein